MRLFPLFFLLVSLRLSATTYYVDQSATGSANGLSWANAWIDITNAVPVVAPGDVVLVRPGTYVNRVVATVDGTAGSPIYWVAVGTPAMVKTVGWHLNSADHNWVVGFDVSHTNAPGTQNYHAIRFENLTGGGAIDNVTHHTESDSNGGVACVKAKDVTIRGNEIYQTFYTSGPLWTSSGAAGIFFGISSNPSTNCVSEYNWIHDVSDHHNTFGPGSKILNCVLGPIDSTTAAHVDGWQPNAVSNDAEMSHCTQLDSQDPGAEGIHLALTSAEASRSMVRGCIVVNGVGEIAVGDLSTNFFLYHLTFVNPQYVSSFQNLVNESATCVARNNIWHTLANANPVVHTTASGGSVDFDYEVVYPASSGYSKPNSLEVDPLLVNTNNATPDFRIGSSSPARGAAGALTRASGSGSSSTSLTVTNIVPFVVGDWVFVGTNGPAKITASTPGSGSTGTYTLATALSWSDNDAVYWSTPSGVRYSDIGAFQYSANSRIGSARYSVNGTTVTAVADFESRMAVLYDGNGVPSAPIYSPTSYVWTASSVSKVRVYPWFAQYSQSQRWVDASLYPNATVTNLSVGTVLIRSN